MSVKPEQCDANQINRFFDGLLSEAEKIAFEGHLERCVVCRRWLTDSAAGPTWWSNASCYLQDEAIDLEPLSREIQTIDDGSTNRVFPVSTPTTQADIERVQQLLAPTDDPRMIGRLAAYEIVGIIGSGGMGIVLKGFDSALNRYVAIKLLAPHLATSAAARMRFAREAQAAAAVVHENVIEIYGVAETKGIPYLVMPYVRGESLQRRLDEAGRLTVTEVLRIGMQTASGLAAAHAQGLVHRDIKPANILLADGIERVTLTDFGLARAADDASLTHTGLIAGTPQFMSPEQARGDRVDHRSDLFSLGSLLYTMCTGRPPFRADTSYGVLSRIVETSPRPIQELNTEVPNWLCHIIHRLHEKSASDRYESATEIADLLEQCLAHVQQPLVSPLPSGLQVPEINRRTATLNVLLGCTIVAGVTLSGVMAIRHWQRDAPQTNAVNSNSRKSDSANVESNDLVPNWDDGLVETMNLIDSEIGQLDDQVSRWPEMQKLGPKTSSNESDTSPNPPFNNSPIDEPNVNSSK